MRHSQGWKTIRRQELAERTLEPANSFRRGVWAGCCFILSSIFFGILLSVLKNWQPGMNDVILAELLKPDEPGTEIVPFESPPFEPSSTNGKLRMKILKLQWDNFQLELQVARLNKELVVWHNLRKEAKKTRDMMMELGKQERILQKQLARTTTLNLPPNYGFTMHNEEFD